MDWPTALLGAALAFVVATATTPAGVSGAFLLVPIQVGILGVPSPQVTATNLLYNVIAAPGSIVTYARARRVDVMLTTVMLVGTCPGVAVGAWVRVEYLADASQFRWIMAVMLCGLGAWLLLGRTPARSDPPHSRHSTVAVVSLIVGIVGGVYGVGGGSILAPLLVLLGHAVRRVAGAALLTTFITSVVGVVAFTVLARLHSGLHTIAPDCALGAALGVGGLAGGVLGARMQDRVPERGLRRLLGLLVAAVGVRYLVLG